MIRLVRSLALRSACGSWQENQLAWRIIDMKKTRFPGIVSGWVLSVTLIIFGGCSGESTSPPNTPPKVPTPPSTTQGETAASVPSHPSVVVVESFLKAMLRGEDEKIRSLLTPLARKKGEEQGIPFSPEASDTASFSVDQVTPQGEIGAYVHTTLTDTDETGRKEAAEIIWIVAKGEEGWRVAGAAVTLFEGQEKTVINFEEPDVAQQAIAAAERREQQRQKQAAAVSQRVMR